MLQNSASQLIAGKLAATSLLPSSLILIGGLAIWQLWRRQTQLQNKTIQLNNELNSVKKRLAKTNASRNNNKSKFASLNPWASK